MSAGGQDGAVANPRVNNGRIARVVFGGITVTMRVVDHKGVTQLALVGDYQRLRHVAEGTIDDAAYRVTQVARSPHIAGMVVLTVAAIDPAPADRGED